MTDCQSRGIWARGETEHDYLGGHRASWCAQNRKGNSWRFHFAGCHAFCRSTSTGSWNVWRGREITTARHHAYGADNFQAEYQNFTANHLQELNQANDELRQDLANQVGPAGSARALDRISTVMANAYGQGHPWLSCGDLKSVTSDLALASGRSTLEEAADQLLGDGRTVELAYARR
jgi:hypothetical protein